MGAGAEAEELFASSLMIVELWPYQLDDVVKRPVIMRAQYMHGCECSANEKRKRTRKKGEVFGKGSKKSGIHHRRQYIFEECARRRRIWMLEVW